MTYSHILAGLTANLISLGYVKNDFYQKMSTADLTVDPGSRRVLIEGVENIEGADTVTATLSASAVSLLTFLPAALLQSFCKLEI
jgi:hypothetical protein